MLNRVTSLTMNTAAQRTLQTQQSQLARLQDKATSLDKITRPSDDPAATGQALQTRAQLAAAAQYSRNIDDGERWLTASDSALGHASNTLNKIRDLTVQAGNGALNQTAKDAIAVQLDALNKDLLASANTRTLGRNVFAGSSDAASAFDDSYTYNGVPDSTVKRRISAEQTLGDGTGTIRVDADGAAIFGTGDESVFKLVNGMAAALRNGEDITAKLTDVDKALEKVITARADVGTRQLQLERAGTVNTELEATLDAQKAGIEKADLGSVILELKLQENNYQVALAATARVLQPTLMDFLR